MNEVKLFIFNNNVRIMLISETHLARKHYFNVPSYSIYHVTYPEGIALN